MEVKAKLGFKVVLALWDVKQFFDSLDIRSLIERAMDADFPPAILALSLCVHRGPRILKAKGTLATPIDTTGRSIMAGCTNSTSFSRAYMKKIIASVGEEFSVFPITFLNMSMIWRS